MVLSEDGWEIGRCWVFNDGGVFSRGLHVCSCYSVQLMREEMAVRLFFFFFKFYALNGDNEIALGLPIISF